MSDLSKDPVALPSPPAPMTAAILMAYLESMADQYEIENEPVIIKGREVVNATVENGKVVLRTWIDELNLNPPCPSHTPVQHRDAKPRWCNVCGLTADWQNPHIPKRT